jgi:hypothetical protein
MAFRILWGVTTGIRVVLVVLGYKYCVVNVYRVDRVIRVIWSIRVFRVITVRLLGLLKLYFYSRKGL